MGATCASGSAKDEKFQKCCLSYCTPVIPSYTPSSRSDHTMAHPFSTQTLGNLDLPNFISGNPHGNSSYKSGPHEWMTNGKIVENGDYNDPYGRDGLGHGVEGGYNGQGGWSARIGDWKGGDANGVNEGTFLEQCHARDCFFGCGRDHSQQGEYVGRYDSRGIGWRYVVDGGQGRTFTNELDYGLGNKYVLESRYPRSSRHRSKIILSDRRLDSQTIGLGFHGRHASVPSSPTQPIPSRQRRLSEPFNVLTADYFSSKISVPGSPISAASEEHGSVNFKDNSKPILFKTELCRSWEEKGSCRYGYEPFLHGTH